MALFVWQDIYSVGVESLDMQHQKLFEIANRFHEAYTNNRGRRVTGFIFAELINYTSLHFEEEERLMRENAYPDFFRHKENHDKLVGLVLKYKEQFEQGEEGIEQRVMEFIKTWLNGHILGMDRNYRPYLTSKSNNQEMNVAAHIASKISDTPSRFTPKPIGSKG